MLGWHPCCIHEITVAPCFLIQSCAYCGREHRLNLDRGGSGTKAEPFDIPVGSTLEVRVDGKATPQTVTFEAGNFPDPASVTALQLRDKLNASLSGATATLDLVGTGVTIESDAKGEASRFEVTGGTARAALGFPVDGIRDAYSGRAVLGADPGNGLKHKDIIWLRRCASGAQEHLIRTWDVCDPKLAGTHHYEYRRVVNALAMHLSEQGWVDPALATEMQAEPHGPPDVALGLPAVVLSPACARLPSLHEWRLVEGEPSFSGGRGCVARLSASSWTGWRAPAIDTPAPARGGGAGTSVGGSGRPRATPSRRCSGARRPRAGRPASGGPPLGPHP